LRIQLVSDIHVEFDGGYKPYRLPRVKRDLLVVAGDLGEGENGREFLMHELKFSPVVYVLGNHEFYNHNYHNLRAYWAHKDGKLRVGLNRLHVLDDRAVTLDGVRFIGATLWTDFDRNSPATKLAAQRKMSDYHYIGHSAEEDRLLRPEDAFEAHQKSRAFIANELVEGHERSVVVTHHAPSPQSIPVGYRELSVNGCYVSDLSGLIEQFGPTVWCHGHTHVKHDYRIGGTRVLCNPRGYASYETTEGYDPGFVFEV